MTKRFLVFPYDTTPASWVGRVGFDSQANPWDEPMAYENFGIPYPEWTLGTDYAIPGSDVVYVDPATGSDANAGTLIGAPKQTIWGTTGAYNVVPAGGTIVLRAGTYREGEKTGASKAFDVQPYPGETVKATGLVTLGAFTQEGTTYYTAFTSGHRPETNTGQANPNGTQTDHHNTSPTFNTNIDSLCGFPVLEGAVGSGVGLWPCASLAVASLTRSGTTATCTTVADHGMTTGDTVHVFNVSAGSTYTGYNGTVAVTVTGVKTFTYTVSSSLSTTAVQAYAPGIRCVSKRQLSAATHTYFHDPLADAGAGRLYLSFNPASTTIQAANLRTFVTGSGSSLRRIRGVQFYGFATRYGDATYNTIVKGIKTVENCSFAGATGEATNGCTYVRHCAAIWTRTLGSSSGLNFWRDYARFMNNMFDFANGWHAGLIKLVISGSVDGICRESLCEYARGASFWADYAGINTRFVANLSRGCAKFGYSLEGCIGDAAEPVDLVSNVSDSDYFGLGCTSTDYLNWVNSIGYRNAIECRVYERLAPPDQRLGHLQMKNLVLAAANGSPMPGYIKRPLLAAHDGFTNPTKDFTTFFAAGDFDGVRIHRPSTLSPSSQHIKWDIGTTEPTYTDNAAFVAATGLNANGSTHDDVGDRLVVDALAGDFRPTEYCYPGRTITTRQRTIVGLAAGLADAVAPPSGPIIWPGMIPGGLSLRHNFNGANSATVQGSATTGQAGTDHAGSHGISGNKGYASTDANNDLRTYDAKTANGYVELQVEGTLNHATDYRTPAVVFSGVDGSNYLMAYLQNGTLVVAQRLAGTITTLKTIPGLTTTNGVQYRVKVKKDGGDLTAYLDGVVVGTHALTGAVGALMAGTRVGYHWRTGGAPLTAAFVNNLWVARL